MSFDHIHQCPRCELRFEYRGDLEDHLRADHSARTMRRSRVPVLLVSPEAVARRRDADVGLVSRLQ